eukprot:SAG11_NODE_35125_length_268_cov_0.615385_1_plen_25_part_10
MLHALPPNRPAEDSKLLRHDEVWLL